MPSNHDDDFGAWVAARTDSDLVSFILSAVRASNDHASSYSSRTSAAIELRNLYRFLDPATQERFKLACLTALQEWDLPVHKLEPLQSLCALVAYLRLERAVSTIAEHLESTLLPRLEVGPGKSEVNEVASYLVSVLRGFAPSRTVQHYFEKWFFERVYTPFVGQFFLGLCACDRRNAREYFSRLAQLSNVLEDSPIDLPHFSFAMVEVLGVQAITKIVNELPSPVQKKILLLLVGGDSPPVHLLVDRDTREFGLVSRDAQSVPTVHTLGANAREVSWQVWTELDQDPVQSILEALGQSLEVNDA